MTDVVVLADTHIRPDSPRRLPPAVYAALERLEEKGFVTSGVGEPTPQRGGRAKRYFRLTGKGLRQVRETQRTLIKLWQGIPALQGATR